MAHRSGPARLARRLGARIRSLREDAGITQERAAWDCDLSKAHLSQIEAGRCFPSVPVLFALAKRLGVDLTDLAAVDKGEPKTQLLDAIRVRDVEGLRAALRALGMLDMLTLSARTPTEKPRKRKPAP